SRIAVLKQLMAAKVPMAFLQEVREGVDIRRRSLEKRVFAQRKQDDQNRNRTPGGVSNIFDHRPSEQSIERNRFQITAQEEAQQRGERAFLDNGIYSASRELAMLASLIRGGTLDEPPEKAERGRATFEARELTRKMPTVNKAPRIKVEEVQPPPTEAPKRDIAQTPEEIRRKLAARLEQRNAGKATFAARDIPHAASGDTPARKETPAAEPETPRSGKAVFGARDIEPAVPHGFYGRKKEEEEKKEDKPRNGRATFESRDLDSPFNKKD
ncbi:MAG TPA: hypothetical protein VJ998_03650, partial [Pseudomonadales bacterium]|nr:hypothetical protein [Pseudomonadales bacterium]